MIDKTFFNSKVLMDLSIFKNNPDNIMENSFFKELVDFNSKENCNINGSN